MRNPVIPFLLLGLFILTQIIIKPFASTEISYRQLILWLIGIYLIFAPWITFSVLKVQKKINRIAAFAIGIFSATIVLMVYSYYTVLVASNFDMEYVDIVIFICVCWISVYMAGFGVLALIVSFFIKPPMPKQDE